MNRKRWIAAAILMLLSLGCGLSVWRLGAANPTSGMITPASPPLHWDGVAAGGISNGEATCVEGVNCDTFTLVVSGTAADWAGKRIEVVITWVLLASDYDLYIHKDSNAGPLIGSSTGGPPSTSEQTSIEPADLDADGSTVFTVHVVYFAATTGDQYHGTATVVTDGGGGTPTPTPGPVVKSDHWKINYHGTCCEGNLAAAGNNTYVLLPVLVTGNIIKRSTDGGQTWTQTYPPAPLSFPFGIEGDMQAFGNDSIFFGTELADAVVAHSSDGGATWRTTQAALASGGNDQAWAYLGPFGDLRPGGPLPTDEPYVLAGWMRIGTALAFSFDGGLTFTAQTPLVGNNGSGPEHIVCHQNAQPPVSPDPGDTRVSHSDFRNWKAGRHGTWGTDRKFYWTETVNNGSSVDLYVCQTSDFGVNWTGNVHPAAPGPGSGFVVTHSAFDENGTLYVLHGNKLYVSFNQGKTFAYIHTLPRYGNAGRSDSGADQYFAVNCGTIHIGLLEDAGEGRGDVFYLRGTGVDTATPIWDQELVDQVGNVRLDFMYIVLDGNNIPTISYTTPGQEVTTASRNEPMPVYGGSACAVSALSAVSRKVHGNSGTFDLALPFSTNPGIECRSGGPNGEHQIVVNFASPITVGGASVASGTGSVDSVDVSGTSVTINLSGVANAQTITVTLTNVNNGTNTGDVSVPMGVLAGDTNADRLVNSADIAETKSQSGRLVSGSNFREDLNTDGSLNSADIALVKSKSGTALP